MSNKFAKIHNKNGDELMILGSTVKKSDGSTNWAEEGAQVNVIETVKVNDTSLTPVGKAVNIIVDTYTLSAVQNPSSSYSAQYKLMKYTGGTGTPTQVGDTINIPKDMVVESGTVVDITFDSSTNKLYDGLVDVTELIVGPTGTATAADAGKYIKLVIANATSDKIYISAKDIVSSYTAGNGITISSNAISVKYGNGLSLNSGNLVVDAGSGTSVDSGGVNVNTGDGLEVDGNNNVKVKLNSTNPGLEADSNGIKVKINATNPGIVLDSNGLAVKVKQTNSGLTLDSNGLSLNIDSNSDLTVGSNGLKLSGESSTASVVYFTEITI